MLTSEADIVNLTGVVQVHVVKSKDRFQSAFCFISSTSKKKCILQYTTESPKGPVACFTPEILEGEIKWKTEGVVKIFEKYTESDWCDSTYCMDIGQEQFYRYQQWLITWLKKNKVYSVFEGDSTIRTFLTDSFNYFCKTLTDRVQARAPLFLPEVNTYSIRFKSREKVTAVGVPDVTNWYQMFNHSHNRITIYQAIETINLRDYIYLRDVESGRSRYYLIISPKIHIVTDKISTPATLLPAMMKNKTIATRLARLRTYNVADQALSRTERVRNSSNSENESDTIVLTDTISFYQREKVKSQSEDVDDSDGGDERDENIPVSSRPQFKSYRKRNSSSTIPLDTSTQMDKESRRIVTQFTSTSPKNSIEEAEENEESIEEYSVHTKFPKPQRSVRKKQASIGVIDKTEVKVSLSTPTGITLSTTPCNNPNQINNTCPIPFTPDLPNSNGIIAVIIFVTFLILFIFIFVIIYIESEKTLYMKEQPYGIPPEPYGPPPDPYGPPPQFYPGY